MGQLKKMYKGELLSASQIWYRENLAHVKEYNKTLNKGTPLGRPIVNHTEEEKKASLKRALDKYNKTPKGKATNKKNQTLWLKTPKGKATIQKNVKKWRMNNPHMVRWRHLLKSALLRLNQPKQDSTKNLLKYSANQLNEHLLKLGYNKDIHSIDHRIPVSWFRNDTPPHIVNHLSNIHPLNKKDNEIKGNRFAHSIEEAYYYESFPFIKNMYQQRIYVDKT